MIYFIAFFMSCLFTYIANNKFNKNKKKSGILFSFIAIFILAMLAGLRDTSIGTDVEYYLTVDLNSASNFSNFFSYYNYCGEELLFALLVFVVNKCFNNINFLMFIIQLIMTILVYLEIYRNRKKYNMALSMFIYCIFVYPRFLNIIRQGIAISIVIFSMRFVENKKIKKFLTTIIIASFFHRTAIIALSLYFLYNNVKNNKKYNLLFIYCVIFIAVIGYDQLLKLLINMGLLPSKYNAFLTKFMRESIDIDFATAFYKIIWISLLLMMGKYMKPKDDNYKFYFHLLIIDIILWELNYKILNAERLSYYFGLIGMINLYPQLYNVQLKNKKQKVIVLIFIILISLFYFYWKFIYFHSGEIYPYKLGV